jgi:voltage-gated potassium channel
VTARARFRRLRDALLGIVHKAGWAWIGTLLLALYVLGAVLMPSFEGRDSPLASIRDYTWWFVVTATTVGYGDIAPGSLGGRATAVVIMLLGIGVIAVAVAKLAESVIDFGRRRMKGLTQLGEADHLVIFGYSKGETESLVRELRQDRSAEGLSIVLCSYLAEENPLQDVVKFVHGDLASEDVLDRACVARAAHILIHGHDDSETIVVSLAARSVNSHAHIVALLRQPENEMHLKRIDPNIECVTPLSIPLMVQSLQDPGVTAVIASLLSNSTDDTICRLNVVNMSRTWNFGALQRAFKDRLGATLVAVASGDSVGDVDLNPASDFVVKQGTSLFYIARRRILPQEVAWDEL